MQKLFLFTDYRGLFYSSTKHRGAGVDLEKLKKYFSGLGFELIIKPLAKINFRKESYKDRWVLYQSSEDPGLQYRSFIDDLILGLHLQGARLIPSLPYFRAHHNKHFLEILRDIHSLPDIKNISSSRYGTYEDYSDDLDLFKDGSYVLKASSTSKSRGVRLLDTLRNKIALPKKVSLTPSVQNLRYYLERFVKGTKPHLISNHRNKFIVQNYIDGLRGDYRIVIYGNKFYVLYRANRLNDFRASGSMLFDYNIEIPQGLLDYAKKVFDSFNTPYMALDVGVKDGEFFLLEFQFLSFGQYALEKSSFYYQKNDGLWQKVVEVPDLEREIARSVAMFVNNQYSKPCVE